ncbi:helix-turn-helix domain-containing protein [Thiohalocapsa marina]|uniref:Helix-turn-helix domain-containing protein n=1 Tax=Thiohalocapsa marina TaxID=424902 RepID=A0A5M8FRB3_9GAMM|nr:helix-turn-helix transcriptional regulator [Thiohalocapsa marina]KAA6185285.1 helix-turn-helix domain-containing protein [Thiohalocapsa marina]
MAFAAYIRDCRERLRQQDRRYSLRQTAQRVGMQPAYLSKIERGDFPPPSEEKIRLIAEDLGEDCDVLLAMAGKVSQDLQEIIRARPALFAKLIRALRSAPDDKVEEIAREIRDGEW